MIAERIIQSASFNETEIEVADILFNLKDLIQESETRSRVTPIISSCKRKRPDINLGLNNSPCSSEDSDNVEVEPKLVELKSEGINPDTPLEFSPSEVDDKDNKHSSKKSSKRKRREKLQKEIEKLTRCREVLRRQVEIVRSYYNRQKTYNLELKAMKERVMTNLNGQGLGLSLGQHIGSSTVQPNYQQPIIVDQRFQYPMGQLPQAQPIFSSTNGLGFVNHTGPTGIPDLNVTFEETFTTNSMSPFEHNKDFAERKAQFAVARRKRREKLEIKRSSGFIRPPSR